MQGTIDLAGDSQQRAAREKAQSLPLADFDVSHPELFKTDSFWPYFDRLRREEPVHYCKDSMFGPYWSVTKYNDIMDIETNHSVFSSAAMLGGITIRDTATDLRSRILLLIKPLVERGIHLPVEVMREVLGVAQGNLPVSPGSTTMPATDRLVNMAHRHI